MPSPDSSTALLVARYGELASQPPPIHFADVPWIRNIMGFFSLRQIFRHSSRSKDDGRG